jgi:hypothetical protein
MRCGLAGLEYLLNLVDFPFKGILSKEAYGSNMASLSHHQTAEDEDLRLQFPFINNLTLIPEPSRDANRKSSRQESNLQPADYKSAALPN